MTGDVNDPQAEIVAVGRTFENRTVTMDKPDVQEFSLSTIVSFIDVSNEPENVYKSAPIVSARLPNDFFYPLTQNSAFCNYFKATYVSLILFFFVF